MKGIQNETSDRCLFLLISRHGLRVSETCGLVLEQVDVESRVLHIPRLKGGLSTTHQLRGKEIRAITAWLVER
ncbi:tyrosine-type recombinase/integrase [Cyanobium gracile]|uniref:tyrosine-type recombinase/integrase n=1 Tax=Cyanobium gracile TaxID=59930 RepID=UPI001C12380C